MIAPRYRIAFAVLLLIFTIASLAVFYVGRSAREPNAALESFRGKVERKQSGSSQHDGNPRGLEQFSEQIKLLQLLIARKEYRRALELIDNSRMEALPAEYREEWLRLSNGLSKKLRKERQDALENSRIQVDLLTKDVQKGCIAAKIPSDLEPLFERCADLQSRIEKPSDELSNRLTNKLGAIAMTLDSWAMYLDCRDTGNTKRAIEVLTQLKSNGSRYAALPPDDVEAEIKKIRGDAYSPEAILEHIFKQVKSCEDLAAAADYLETNANKWNDFTLAMDTRHIIALRDAWSAAQANDEVMAMKVLTGPAMGFGRMDFYDPLNDQVLCRLIQGKAGASTALVPAPGEDPSVYLGKILDELFARDEYGTMLELMNFTEPFSALTRSAKFDFPERESLSHLLTARRFESAGDNLAALNNYRLALSSSATGKYAPNLKVQEAMSKLQKTDPEIFRNSDSVIMDQMRILKEQYEAVKAMQPPPQRPWGK